MRLLVLDLATRTGFAEGEAGQIPPTIGAVVLKGRGESADIASANLGCFLRDRLVFERPDMIVVEHYMQLAGQPSDEVGELHLLLHGAVKGIAGAYGIPVKAPYADTIRTHFCGRPRANMVRRPRGSPALTSRQRAENREATKKMVRDRAIALGYLPHGCLDSDRADAAALFDFASVTYGRIAPRRMVLFGETVHA